MSIQVRNGITPEIERQAARLADRRPILEAMGHELKVLTKEAFMNESVRPSTWPPLKPETLKRKKGRGGMLRGPLALLMRSIHQTALTNDSVSEGTDRPYAAIHQLGGQAGRNHAATIPARPYFPIINGKLTPLAQARIGAAAAEKTSLLLG